LAVTLTGTMVADNPIWSMALLIDNSSRSSFTAKVNQNILEGDSKLIKIERDRIILEREGQLEQIEINETGNIARAKPTTSRGRSLPSKPLAGSLSTPRISAKSTPASPKKSGGATGAAASLKTGIKKINENQFEVSRKTLNDVIKNPAKFRDGTRPIPNYEGGKVNGFKLVNMKPGSIYYDLGIRPGDVITAVNGKPLDSPNRALELYQKLGSLSNVSLEVQRNGQKRQMSFNIK
jgi:general secretion pathway protein C